MNRQTWNWCETDIAGFDKIAIFLYDPYLYFSCDFCEKEYTCESNIPYSRCRSLNYPAKRLVGFQIVDWPDEKTLCVEEPKTKLDTYVIYHVRRSLDPQGVKYDK